MTLDDFHAMLTTTQVAYQSAEDPERPAKGDVVTATRETEGQLAVWRLVEETWLRCGTITIGDDARAWNACQMERFWNGRSGPFLQLGPLHQEPPPLAGGPVKTSELAGPVTSILRVVHLAWRELHGHAPGYGLLWCDDVDLRLPLGTKARSRKPSEGKPKRGRGNHRTCRIVDVRGSGRALRWA